MKFIIDSANIDNIEKLLSLGITDGITTNPTILYNEKQSRKEQLINLSKITNQTLFVQLVGETTEDLLEDYNKLLDIFKEYDIDYVIKVVIDEAGLKAIHQIKKINPQERFLATTIYTTTQAILAITSGCQYIAPYYNRMLVAEEDANQMIHDARVYIEEHGYDCTIIAASLKSIEQVRDALMAGAHTCTLDPELLEDLMKDERVERDSKVFIKHHQTYNQ